MPENSYLCRHFDKQKIVAVKTKNNGKSIAFYDGDLTEFAREILDQGRGNGSVCRICAIVPEIVADMRLKGKMLVSNDIIVTQKEVFKYRHHPKAVKGANIPLQDYNLIENALLTPTHIYEDTVQNRLVYVCTHPYHHGKLVKVVVEPNFKSHRFTVNIAKSWGIVQEENMRGEQFKCIK